MKIRDIYESLGSNDKIRIIKHYNTENYGGDYGTYRWTDIADEEWILDFNVCSILATDVGVITIGVSG